MKKVNRAIRYGADAVYLGGEQFGPRANAGNFSISELAEAVTYAHGKDKQVFLTLNAYLFPEEFSSSESYLEELKSLGLDAYIVSDPGLVATVRRVDPEREIHLSTQANTTNAQSANFWKTIGVSRVNLARELSLDEIAHIRKGTDSELEIFVHGAMCVAYSGRCLLSTSMTGRSANSGACAQPCRWNYSLVEESRPGEFYPVEEDDRGTYIFNSRDLCLADRVPELIAAGVDSLKIEGRMKTLYYVAAVTRIYREIIDRYCEDPKGFQFNTDWIAELEKISHRPHAHGFMDGRDDPRVFAEDSQYRRTHDFVGVVRSHEQAADAEHDGRACAEIDIRTKTLCGDELELIGPGMQQATIRVEQMFDEKGALKNVAQPNDCVKMLLPEWAEPGDILRRAKIQTLKMTKTQSFPGSLLVCSSL